MTVKQRLQKEEILLAPGIYDAFSAMVAEQTGFEAVYLSGASIAYTTLGRSDVGLTTFTEVNEKIAQIRDRIKLPIIVDADTGFGNALNTERTVRGFERSGAIVRELGLPTVVLQEGGYDVDALGENVRRWLAGLSG
jgi:2-methylisocitrate lyase-like PEP mutase family enzyme